MAELTKLLADLSIISILDNEPNDVGGLSAEEFKAKFDEAANIIKDYINETLLPELASTIGAENVGIATIAGVTGAETVQTALEKLEQQMAEMTQGAVADNSINTAKLVDGAVTATKLANLAVTSAALSDGAVEKEKIAALAVATAKLADLAVTSAKIADKAVIRRCIGDKAVGTAQIGDGAVGTTQIDALAVTAAKLGAEAVETAKIKSSAVTAPKIADNAVSTVYTATLDTTWSGDEAPYTKAQTISGILATDKPIIDLVPSDTFEDAEAQEEAWANIYRAVTSANTITFYAKEIPEVSIPIQVRCIRK